MGIMEWPGSTYTEEKEVKDALALSSPICLATFYVSLKHNNFFKNIYFILIFFKILVMLHGLWDSSSPTRGWTQALGSESMESKHWMAREFPTAIS